MLMMPDKSELQHLTSPYPMPVRERGPYRVIYTIYFFTGVRKSTLVICLVIYGAGSHTRTQGYINGVGHWRLGKIQPPSFTLIVFGGRGALQARYNYHLQNISINFFQQSTSFKNQLQNII